MTTVVLAQSNAGGAGVPYRELALVLLTAAVVTFLATGGVRRLAIAFGAVAIPRERDVHVKPTPRMGGVGMYLGVMAALLFAHQLPALTRGFEFVKDIPATMVAITVIVAVGIIDDRWGIDALTKFVGQVTAASVMVLMGLSWFVFYDPIDKTTVVLDQLEGGLVTGFIAVAIMNAMNFIDGLDGLAAGLGLIAASASAVFSIGLLHENLGDVNSYPPALLAAALAGACLGFLPHNFEPARIFMGDTGSMLIGLMLAAIATGDSGRIPLTAYGTRDVIGLLAPFLLVAAFMFIPVLDMLLAIVRRTRAGVSPFSPDKMHLHHRLLQIGHSVRRVVLLIYLWVGVLAFGAVGVAMLNLRLVAVLLPCGLLFALIATLVPTLRAGLIRRRTPSSER
jgi:UDP-GlcNAc:undecaprenyl-phosphate GlcNAc-1-phosphate transferase